MSESTRAIRVIAFRQPFVAFETRLWHPSLNLYETEEGFVLVADLAGVNPSDLQVHVHPTLIMLQGVRQLRTPSGLRRIHRMEIGAGRFELEVALSRPIDPERTEAHYQNGLLEVHLPYAYHPPQRVAVVHIEGGVR